MHVDEELMRHELDVIMRNLAQRIAQQERNIDDLKGAHKPIRQAKKRLTLLGKAFVRLETVRAHFYAEGGPLAKNTTSPHVSKCKKRGTQQLLGS